MLRAGNQPLANHFFQKAVDITPEMTLDIIKVIVLWLCECVLAVDSASQRKKCVLDGNAE